jgi:hypothetical protein
VPRTATWQPTGTPVSEDYTSASGYFHDKIAWAQLDAGVDDHGFVNVSEGCRDEQMQRRRVRNG